MTNRKNLKIEPDTYDLLREEKDEYETWDGFFHRVFGGGGEIGNEKPDESIFQDNGQVWAGDPAELQEKLGRHYGVEGLRYNGDFYHEGRDEYLYDVLTYWDGDEEHFITGDVPMFGHGPSGAVGMDRDSLPPKEAVREVVDGVKGGDTESGGR